jgi:hypothetical protein
MTLITTTTRLLGHGHGDGYDITVLTECGCDAADPRACVPRGTKYEM